MSDPSPDTCPNRHLHDPLGIVTECRICGWRPAAGSFPPDVTALAKQMGLADDPFFAREYQTNIYVHALMHLAEAQAARITELERWKAEALVVLGQWDEVWEALGRPGPLGSSKAVEALTEAHRLRATDPPADVHPRHPRQETT